MATVDGRNSSDDHDRQPQEHRLSVDVSRQIVQVAIVVGRIDDVPREDEAVVELAQEFVGRARTTAVDHPRTGDAEMIRLADGADERSGHRSQERS